MKIGESFQNATDGFFAFLPNLLGFLVLLLIGFIVAKVVSTIISKLLQKIGLDRQLHESDANKYVDKVLPGASPSKGIARVVFWLIFIFFLFSAIGALKIPAVTTFMNQVLSYLPNVIVAILIFVVAALISGAVAGGVAKVMGDTPTGKIVATIVPALVMVIAMFMILEQLQIAPEIVRIAFAAVMFALALGLALAFGLGGRPVAERLLEDGYRKGQEAKAQAKSDLQTGRDRAQEQAGNASSQSTGSAEYSGSSGSSGYSEPGTVGTESPYSDDVRPERY
ncbi:MAG: mechanosensitive ion channel [Nocardioides sp.]